MVNYTGSKAVIYVDGVEKVSKSVANAAQLAGNLRVGGRVSDLDEFFNGSIDDIRIYNRALSAEEVKALYDLEKPKGK